ncbi:hypothetical protein KUTeg_011549 [Tegillarca granosa]|uniref:Serpin domain-containing protein n=1 Tax=Tegillarca granosa TaxID=220873 RepID=A0ABQ9EWX0_TEGGR|nr:hypothetical protein KUTeg_011549 [Tegillarca granosa]
MRGLDNFLNWFSTYYIRIFLIGWLSLSEVMASNKIFEDKSMSLKFSSSNIQFSLAMYKHLAALKKNENIFYSPFSISASLSMALLGAKTSTLKQMMTALALEDMGQNVHEAYEVYLKEIMAGNENFTLKAANRIYPHVKANLVRDYLNLCTKHYHADITPLDYSNSPGPARETINKWVSDQTADKIQDLIPDGVLNDLTIAVLVNAIYFKGNWASQFKQSLTRQMPFHTPSGEKIQVQMMYQNEKFNYMHGEEMKISALEMPYKGDYLSMLFVLPDTVEGLSALEEKLTPNLLDQISSSMKPRKTEVYIPRFKMEAEFELSSILSKMGMPEAFSDVADFSGMDESKQTYISQVFHKGFVEVNEEGAEAAAATGTVMMYKVFANNHGIQS